MNFKYFREVSLVVLHLSASCSLAQNTFWRTYGGNSTDFGKDVKQTADQGYIVCGSSGSFGSNSGDMYVLKLDSLGDVEWSMLYGGQGVDEAVAIAQADDKGYFIAGNTTSQGAGGYDGLIVRTDSNGVQLWERTYGGADWDLLNEMAVVNDGAFLVGQTFQGSFSSGAIWLIRVDLLGDTLWTKQYNAPMGAIGKGVSATMDGGCVVSGTVAQSSGDRDAVLLKYDAFGALEWDLIIGGDSLQEGNGVIESSASELILCGTTKRFSAFSEILVAKVSSLGSVIWEEHYGQVDDFDAFDIVAKDNGDPVISGYTKAFGSGGKDQYQMFLDGNGGFIQGRTKGGLEDEEAFAIDRCGDGGFVMCGTTSTYGPGQTAFFIVRTDSMGDPSSDPVVVYPDVLGLQAYFGKPGGLLHPNPARPGDQIHVQGLSDDALTGTIKDMHGRTLAVLGHVQAGTFVLPVLSAGPYLLEIVNDAGLRQQVRTLLVAE